MQKKVIRVGKDLKVYEKTSNSWKLSKQDFPNIITLTKLFKAHNNFGKLIDQKDNKFLKGQLCGETIQGARINILPTGEVLDKAYSIFAKNLTFHDESSHDHWDVIYQNPNGKYAYLYTLDKRQKAVSNKYKKVEKFEKIYPALFEKVKHSLNNNKDDYALPMYTLLTTYMRIGNETYYKANGHKGLTTLTKKDISIKGNNIKFTYLAKSGVPMQITQEFPSIYVSRLKSKISNLKNSDFIFSNEKGLPLKDTYFMSAFEKYCGEKFYPHIVRSYYATSTAKEFLKAHKQATKKEVQELFTSIAERLGHKRFSKKDNEWKDSYTVTIHHYLEPKILDKVNSLIK